jgi:hypothetical protein
MQSLDPVSQEDEKRWVPSYPLPQLPRSPLYVCTMYILGWFWLHISIQREKWSLGYNFHYHNILEKKVKTSALEKPQPLSDWKVLHVSGDDYAFIISSLYYYEIHFWLEFLTWMWTREILSRGLVLHYSLFLKQGPTIQAPNPLPPPSPKKNPYKSIPAGYIYSLWGDQSTAIIRLVHLSDDSYSLLVRKWWAIFVQLRSDLFC